MTNINIYLNSPLRVSESFMFSNISSWFCPLRWQRNDLWKNTTAHILMKVLKIIYHSHSNYTVGIFQVVLRKTNGWWQVLGCPCWPCPKMPHGTHFWGKRPFSLLVSSTLGNDVTFLTSSYWRSSVTLHLCSVPVYLFRHLKISIFPTLTLLSSYQLGFSQLISLRSEDALVKWSITMSKSVSANI